MPIVIAHGQPKSGSTFLYMTALELATMANGQEYNSFRDERLGPGFPDFHPEVTRETVDRIARDIAPHEYLILKTHSEFTPEIEELIDSGAVLAFTSFRDPRDTILSTLDAGESDRRKGSRRWFSKFSELDELITPVLRQCNRVLPWLSKDGVLAIPFYLIAMRQETSVRILAKYLRFGFALHTLTQAMLEKRAELPEWNKGVADRYIDELTSDDIFLLNHAFAEVLPAFDGHLREHMAEAGHRLFCEWAISTRDARLAEKFAGNTSIG